MVRYPLCSGAKLAKRGAPFVGGHGSGVANRILWVGPTIRLDTLPPLFAII